MINTHRMTFTEESLAFALNQVHRLHDISNDLIAANVFRQGSGTTTTSHSHGSAIGVTDTDVDRLLDTIACLLPYAEDEAALTCDNQQNSEMAWDAADKARDLLEEIERRRSEARPSTNRTTPAKEDHGLDQAEGTQPNLNAAEVFRQLSSQQINAAEHQVEPAIWRYRKASKRNWLYTEHREHADLAWRDGNIVQAFYSHANVDGTDPSQCVTMADLEGARLQRDHQQHRADELQIEVQRLQEANLHHRNLEVEAADVIANLRNQVQEPPFSLTANSQGLDARTQAAAWLGQHGLYITRMEAEHHGELQPSPVSYEELLQHAQRYLFTTRNLGLAFKAPHLKATKTPEETDSAIDAQVAALKASETVGGENRCQRREQVEAKSCKLDINTPSPSSQPTAWVEQLDIALAEFLRGKMGRLRASYTLAFEAGWNARGDHHALSPTARTGVVHDLEEVEGDQPDINSPLAKLAELAAKRLIDAGAENYIGDVFTISLNGSDQSFEVIVTTQRSGAKTPHELHAEAVAERDSLRLQMAERGSLLEHWFQLANVCDSNLTDLMKETRALLDQQRSPWECAARDVLTERRRQISKGHTAVLDDIYGPGELTAYGVIHALLATGTNPEWDGINLICEWEVKPAEPRPMLVKAIALQLAALESLDRTQAETERLHQLMLERLV